MDYFNMVSGIVKQDVERIRAEDYTKKLEEALWLLMRGAEYGMGDGTGKALKSPKSNVQYFRSIGFCDGDWNYWTDAAHDFAARMATK